MGFWTRKPNGASKQGCQCEELKKSVPTVHLSDAFIAKAAGLCASLPDLEWVAGVTGSWDATTLTARAEDLHVFEQEVSAGFSEFTDQHGSRELANLKGCIGIVHSHNNMAVFYSNTDEKNSTAHQISIVTNNDGEWFGKAKVTLPCGGWQMNEVRFVRTGIPAITPSAETLALIKKSAPVAPVYSAYSGYDGYSEYDGYLGKRTVQTPLPGAAVQEDLCDMCDERLPKNLMKRENCEKCEGQFHRKCFESHDLAGLCVMDETEWDGDEMEDRREYVVGA